MSAQYERLREHARNGLSKAEAADREGVSLSVAHIALKGTDLKWGAPGQLWRAYGTTGDRLSSFHYPISEHLRKLREEHSQEEVSRLTGMNMGEQAQALRKPPGTTYNWTIAQIVRIAEARNITPLELLQEAVKAMEKRA